MMWQSRFPASPDLEMALVKLLRRRICLFAILALLSAEGSFGPAMGKQEDFTNLSPDPVFLPFLAFEAQVPRVNAPYFSDQVRFAETAIFWFGQVNQTSNYADVRVGYTDREIYFRMAAFDRRLWYDPSPSPGDLQNWDAATLFLQLDANSQPDRSQSAYQLVSQLNWWEARDAYQQFYRGDGLHWEPASLPITTTIGWRGDALNDEGDDRGWAAVFEIPFSSLGLSGPPPQGTIWRVGFVLHDRDSAAGPPNPDQIWPEYFESAYPQRTWGELYFGDPEYTPPAVSPAGSVTIRDQLNGALVVDGEVGGGSVCGAGLDYWTQWGDASQPGSVDNSDFNLQNQADVADWPCFAKYYITFPLDSIPAGKAILSAQITLHEMGNSGGGGYGPPPASYIQVFTVQKDWDENHLSWNNAPPALENVSAAWVDPVTNWPGWPGIPWSWDLTRAVAQAYESGGPLRLAFYSADGDYHTGKYFVSSDTGDWNAEARPMLQIVWGNP